VNNAGIYPAKNIFDYTFEEMEQVYKVNVFGSIYFTRFFAEPLMKQKKKGVIVNMASTSECGGSDPVYGSSKGAISAFTRCCAFSFSPYIRANAVAPGLVETDMAERIPPHILKLYRNAELVHDPIQPDDIANTVFFLLGEQAKNYSGATLDINNGFLRR
jgi:3-oxoacyl-[acyl-carrier protein] reductase